MPFNLIHEAWIPIRRRHGKRQDWIAPWQIVDADDPPIALDAARPDFNGALIQVLIGLVQTAFPPKDDAGWRKYLKTPPTQEELRKAFDTLADAFNLDGDGPKFMQDPGKQPSGKGVEDTVYDIEMLLLGAPQKATRKQNRGHFVKGQQVRALCRACAATALQAVQGNAPGGGRGAYSSLRGVGPITTVVTGSDLWATVWLNVLTSSAFLSGTYGNGEKIGTGDKFPWVTAVTRHGKAPLQVRPLQANPALMFWGTPWRIWLTEWEDSGACGLCGRTGLRVSTKFVKVSNGTDYHDWLHTLSPFTQTAAPKRGKAKGKKEDFAISLGTRDAGTCYRYWLGLAFADAQRKEQHVAPVVSEFFDRVKWAGIHPDLQHVAPRLWAFGYEFKKAEAACWHEGEFPMLAVEPSLQPDYERCIVCLVRTADMAKAILIASMLRATAEDRRKPKQRNRHVPCDFWNQDSEAAEAHANEVRWQYDRSVGHAVETAKSRFWKATEREFYETLARCRQALAQGEALDALKLEWLETLSRAALAIFDDAAQTAQLADANPKRVAKARHNLELSLRPDSKSLRSLLGLAD